VGTTDNTEDRALAPLGTARTLAPVPGQWDREQKDVIKTVLAPGISDGELLLFGMICQRTGLDPFMKQIYAIMRNVRGDDGKWTKRMTVQISIDGYRLLAARTRRYAGSDAAVFGPEDSDGQPTWASVTVYRIVQGQRCPFTHTVRWREYVQRDRDGKPTGKWADMPYNQLAKCAEAGALRKAFPAELSGVYTAEEMEQADAEEMEQADSEPTPLNVSPLPQRQRPQPAPAAKPAPALAEQPTAAEPTPIRKRSWSSLRLRAFQVGVAQTEEQWADIVCELTRKNDPRTINMAGDYDVVEAYIADMELKARVQVDEDGGLDA
jgi:phage recombination protein Bet